MEEAARQRGARWFRLEARDDKPAVISFYERAGYRPVGHRPDYYEDGMSAPLLTRELSSG